MGELFVKEIGTVILDSRREESNHERMKRYHCYSLNGAEFEGMEMAYKETLEAVLFLQRENQHIAYTFEKLSEVPRFEKMVDGHTGFLFTDKDGMSLVAMHWEHRFNHMVKRYNDIYRVQMPNITPHERVIIGLS